MSQKHNLPDLYRYRELNNEEQLAINQILISYVQEDAYFNITMRGEVKTYNLVKLISVNFGSATIDILFKTITGESIDLPIDLLKSIEFAGQKEI